MRHSGTSVRELVGQNKLGLSRPGAGSANSAAGLLGMGWNTGRGRVGWVREAKSREPSQAV